MNEKQKPLIDIEKLLFGAKDVGEQSKAASKPDTEKIVAPSPTPASPPITTRDMRRDYSPAKTRPTLEKVL